MAIQPDLYELRFGARLSELRGDRQLSQANLARISLVARSTLSKFETAKKSPRLDQIVAIAKALEVPVKELLP